MKHGRHISLAFALFSSLFLFQVHTANAGGTLVTCPGRPAPTLNWSSSNVRASGCTLLSSSNSSACNFSAVADTTGSTGVTSGSSCGVSLSCVSSGGTTLASDSATLSYNPNLVWNGSACVTPSASSCTTPWGSTVASGSTATGYSTGSVASPATCSPYSQTSTCTNGTFSPSLAGYPNASCTVTSGSTCSNGATNYATCNQCAAGSAYVGSSCVACSNGGCSGAGGNSSTPYGSLSCNNGGSNPTTCTPPAANSCTTPWGTTLASGSSVQAFQTATVTSPATCSSDPVQTRTCNNGTLSGSYQNSNCAQATPTATISASPIRVKSGESTLVTWSSSGVTSCAVSGPSLSSNTQNGSQSVTVTAQSTFTITCQSSSSPVTNSITVNVVPTFQEF